MKTDFRLAVFVMLFVLMVILLGVAMSTEAADDCPPMLENVYYLPVMFSMDCLETELICFAGGYCHEECVR